MLPFHKQTFTPETQTDIILMGHVLDFWGRRDGWLFSGTSCLLAVIEKLLTLGPSTTAHTPGPLQTYRSRENINVMLKILVQGLLPRISEVCRAPNLGDSGPELERAVYVYSHCGCGSSPF